MTPATGIAALGAWAIHHHVVCPCSVPRQLCGRSAVAPWGDAGLAQRPSKRGHPDTFPLQTSTLTVNGVAQNAEQTRVEEPHGSPRRYPADVSNINNAASNLVEIIANAARSDTAGDYPIRIYTIGMGELVRYNLGTMPETSESILMRVANDTRRRISTATQLEGKYYFAQTEADVGPAFQALQNQIIRLSK